MDKRRKKQDYHFYSVYVVAYVDEETKARAERNEIVIQPEQLITTSFYFGESQAQAERKFTQAARAAMSTPLARAVVLERDFTVQIRLMADH